MIFAIAVGGLSLTYLISDDEPFFWRLAAGCIVGSALFGTAGFVIALFAGLSLPAVASALALTLLPAVIFTADARRKHLKHDWIAAKGKLQGANAAKTLRFGYYLFFFLLFLFFFDRAMIVNDQGILTGGSNNLGDLPFHLGAIYAFTEGGAFPPDNPNFAGMKFSYPFVADLISAMFVRLGVPVREAMLVQNVAWAFSLLVVLERFVHRLVKDGLAARLAPFLLFFSGGLGFIWFFGDFFAQTKGFFQFLSEIPKDYTIGDQFRWGNSLVTLFITQRSLLLGMPITLIVLGVLWRVFSADRDGGQGLHHPERSRNVEKTAAALLAGRSLSLVVSGLLAGSLVLIHLHSLAVLFVVCVVLIVLRPARSVWSGLALFGSCVSLVAVPELVWSLSGSATRASEFLAVHFGWDKRGDSFLWFWLKNTGLFIPLLAAGVYLVWSRRSGPSEVIAGHDGSGKKRKSKKTADKIIGEALEKNSADAVLFYVPFALIFVLSNSFKFAPWEWDNIKLLIYWYTASLPFAAAALAWSWRRCGHYRFAAGLAFAFLIFSGGLDVWRTVSGQIEYKVFDNDAITVANRIRASTAPDSVFANAPTYNSAVVLTGRRSLMRYSGHLSSHGIDYRQREADLKVIYRGGPQAEELVAKHGISYILVSPEERNTLSPNEDYFHRYPVVAESGQYKVYRVGGPGSSPGRQ